MLLTGKILILSLLATALNLATVNEPIAPNSANIATTTEAQIGSIVGTIITEDVILYISLNDTGDKIDAVSILDTDGKEVFFDDTSSSSSSQYDLSSLATGTYAVYVTTEKGASFSEDISL